MPVLLIALLTLVLLPFSSRLTLKPVLTVMLLVTATVAYFADHYGTVIDEVMIRNAMLTDSSEVGDLLSMELATRIVLLGILPALWLWRTPLRYRGWRRELAGRFGMVVLATGVVLVVLASFSAHYASFFREYKPLRYYTNPLYPLYSTLAYVHATRAVDPRMPIRLIAADARLPADDPHRELMIFVVGESARADHFSLYGYPRPTNPRLSRLTDLVAYRDVVSCGTSTATSLPCMFSPDARVDFDVREAGRSENLLDVLQRAGVSVLWRDNNSDSKGVALRVPYQDFRTPEVNGVCDPECRDVGMLEGLQEYIDAQQRDILIILHQIGNHGPAYHKRYPPHFEHFTPVCASARLSDCSIDEIHNAYDNAIRHTDWFLAKIVDLLRNNETHFETMMLYVSDHGESLGEHGLFLHGAPYVFAPREQREVPLLIWQGRHNDVDTESLFEQARFATSHDAIFQTVLNYFEVETELLDPDAGLFRVKGMD